MKIQLLYVTLTRLRQFEEFLGIERIYQYLHENDVDCCIDQLFSDLDFEKSCNKINLSCDVFGFSVYYDSIKFILKLCEYIKYKNPKAICFFGSQYASATYAMLLKDYSVVDAVVLGHGEKVILEMMRSLEKNIQLNEIVSNNRHIATRYSLDNKQDAQIDINEICNPSHIFYKENRQLVASLVSKQGCSGVCTFCSCADKFSCKVPEDIFDEILSIYNTTHIQFYNFVDSTMSDMGNEGKENLRRLCERLKEFPVKLSFRCFIRADSFKNNPQDVELLMQMKDVGFSNLFIGIESGNDKDLKLYGKGVNVSDNQECLSLMEQMGYDYKIGFIMINPYSNKETLKENYEFLVKNKCWDGYCYINSIQVYYGTRLYNSLERHDLITEDYSYIDNVFGYKVIDPFAEEVFHFVNDIVVKELDKVTKYQKFNYLFNYINPIIDDLEDEYSIINNQIKNRIAEINKEYYSIIYKENNIEKAKSVLRNYIEKLEAVDNLVTRYNTLLLKRYVLYKKNKFVK